MTKLERIICITPGNAPVTVADYITGEIYVDRETAYNIIHGNDERWHRMNGGGLKNYVVYKIEVGKTYGDLIISILKD